MTLRVTSRALLTFAALATAPELPAPVGSYTELSAQADRREARARMALRARGTGMDRARRAAPRVGTAWMGRADRTPGGVEAVMRARERLGLTDEQFGALDAIRQEKLAERIEAATEMAEMRSLLASGQMERSQAGTAVRERLAARLLAGGGAELRERIGEILTEEQMEMASPMLRDRAGASRAAVGRSHARAAGRAGRWRGRGVRG